MDVTVAKNPIDSISAVITGKNSFYENTHGYINKDENGEEYYYYSADWIMREIFMPTLTVNYNDGRGSVTVKYGDWDSFQEQTGYHIEISDSQYTKHWTLGENTLTLSCLGIECELPFTPWRITPPRYTNGKIIIKFPRNTDYISILKASRAPMSNGKRAFTPRRSASAI